MGLGFRVKNEGETWSLGHYTANAEQEKESPRYCTFAAESPMKTQRGTRPSRGPGSCHLHRQESVEASNTFEVEIAGARSNIDGADEMAKKDT